MVTFSHSRSFRDDDAVGTVNGTAHVGLQLRAVYLTIAVNGIDLSVVVEEYGEVVYFTFHIMVFPGAADVFRRIALQPLAVDVGEYVELVIGIADAGSPDALAVDFIVVPQRKGVFGEVEAVKAIADILPIDQIARMQDDQSGDGVHRRTSQIVIIAHAQYVGVAELVIEKRIRKRAVSVVGGP